MKPLNVKYVSVTEHDGTEREFYPCDAYWDGNDLRIVSAVGDVHLFDIDKVRHLKLLHDKPVNGGLYD